MTARWREHGETGVEELLGKALDLGYAVGEVEGFCDFLEADD